MNADMELACYALTPSGAAMARRLAEALKGRVHLPMSLCREGEVAFESLPLLLSHNFAEYSAHIFVCATGIAVRCIAPHLKHKSVDPAVVVCDEAGKFAISLLSGHFGGGNTLAQEAAKVLGGEAVITTATDVCGLPSLDSMAQEAGLAIVDWDKIKVINAALLRGEKVQVSDPMKALGSLQSDLFETVALPEDIRNGLSLPQLDPSRPAVSVDWRALPAHDNLLRLALPALHVGVGCRKGVGTADIMEAVRQSLTDHHLEPLALAGLASITAKDHEEGLLETARQLGVPLRFFSAEELSDAPTLTPSAMAAQIFGVDHISVSEGSAMLAAGGDDATLLIPKIKHQECITVAVAISENLLPPSADLV